MSFHCSHAYSESWCIWYFCYIEENRAVTHIVCVIIIIIIIIVRTAAIWAAKHHKLDREQELFRRPGHEDNTTCEQNQCKQAENRKDFRFGGVPRPSTRSAYKDNRLCVLCTEKRCEQLLPVQSVQMWNVALDCTHNFAEHRSDPSSSKVVEWQGNLVDASSEWWSKCTERETFVERECATRTKSPALEIPRKIDSLREHRHTTDGRPTQKNTNHTWFALMKWLDRWNRCQNSILCVRVRLRWERIGGRKCAWMMCAREFSFLCWFIPLAIMPCAPRVPIHIRYSKSTARHHNKRFDRHSRSSWKNGMKNTISYIRTRITHTYTHDTVA